MLAKITCKIRAQVIRSPRPVGVFDIADFSTGRTWAGPPRRPVLLLLDLTNGVGA